MQSLHEAGLGGVPVWVPVTVKKKESQLVAGCGAALLPNPRMPRAAVSDASPSVGACAHIILYAQKLSFILSGFF